ncbi:MAG TPA: sugar ABC transporter ATP-binding protein, partial [Microbacteriaceae bacterium]|nr:sugar ABC transporter ATP-binding protein [Microbacteriaceae bacterium]
GQRTEVVARVDGRNHPNAGETVSLTARHNHVHTFDIESGERLNNAPITAD